MPRWFLSYHSPDQSLAERLKGAIERKDPASRVFFAPSNLRAGGAWTAQLAEEIEEATPSFCSLAKPASANGRRLNITRRSTAGRRRIRRSLSSSCCSRGRPRLDCRSCDNCIGSSRPIQARRRTWRGFLTPLPAKVRAPPSYGVTRLPTAVLKRWRRRTATISSAGPGKRSRRSMRSKFRAGCRC